MGDIHNIPDCGIPEELNKMLNNGSGNQRTSYDERRHVLDDLVEDMSRMLTENEYFTYNLW